MLHPTIFLTTSLPTEKLALPPISQVQSRGYDNGQQWYQSQPYHQGAFVERVPQVAGLQEQPSSSSVGSSPRAGSFSASSVANQSYDSSTSLSSLVDGRKATGLQTPSPDTSGYPASSIASHSYPSAGYQYSSQSYSNMNAPQGGYIDVSQSHQQPSGPASSIGHYTNYGQPQALQPATHGYAPTTYSQPYNGYSMAPMTQGHPVTSSMGSQMVQQSLPLPTMPPSQPPPGSAGGQQQFSQSYDTTGQIAPQGMKPRVTATLWEDEGSLCFQVEANGVCVARREDNHFINGTKLLNVAGMTRGRRDGILKSEKTRHVVKIGPMHLKGVW